MPAGKALLALALSAVGSTALEFRDVNIFSVTDVHSWIAGGDKQVAPGTPLLDGTFGDLTSFVERARTAAAKEGKDVFLIDNGDVIDGTGLSNAADDHCQYLLPLLQQVPFDALNCGNHELYSNVTLETFKSTGYIDSWNGTYLTSNLLNATTRRHIGSTSTILVGPVSGIRVLTLGFMYEMAVEEGRCTGVDVVPIKNATKAQWFKEALGDGSNFDAILVLSHMDCDNYLIKHILEGIRAILPDVPVQFIAGHSHERKQLILEGRAAAFEPGNYFNTLGYSSFDLSSSDAAPTDNVTFYFTDIDTAVDSMVAALGSAAPEGNLTTPDGEKVGEAIAAERQALGLTDVLGCAKQDYLEGPDLFNLYVDEIVPSGLFTPPTNSSQWFTQSSGSLRYDIYKGNVTTDDIYKVLPFKDKLYVVRNLLGEELVNLLALLNHDEEFSTLNQWNMHRARGGALYGWEAVDADPTLWRVQGGEFLATNYTPAPKQLYDAFIVQFDVPLVQAALVR